MTSAGEDVYVITDVERVRGDYSPPPDGILTSAQLDRFLDLYHRARKIVERQGCGRYLDPRYVGGNERRRARLSRIVAMATMRAQLQVGMVDREYDWIRRTVKAALDFKDDRRSKGGKGSMSRSLEANAMLLAPYVKRLNELRKGFPPDDGRMFTR